MTPRSRSTTRLAGATLVGLVGVLAALGAWDSARAGTLEPPATLTQPQRPVTFTRDIAPILFERCTVCHHDGAIAPFSLLTYDDARPWARGIKQATATRSMPPWKPAPDHGGPFVGDRRLSDAEIALIGQWVDGGAIQGNPSDMPPAPSRPSDWHLGTPDLVVTMPEPYLLKADGPDEYRNFVIPIPVARAKHIRAFQFRPRSRAVHHARILIDRTGSARRADRADLEPGYDDLLGDAAEFPVGHLLAWAPGKIPAFEDDALAWRLEPGTDLVLQLHLPTIGTPAPVQAQVGLYFADAPGTLSPAVVLLGNKTIDIPPGEPSHVVEDAYRLPVDVDVLAVYPHAHFLGKDLQAFATLPDGSRRWLIRIADWDFNWQDEYRFAEPLHLPAGTTLQMRYVYDNSATNPSNPSHPPKRVRFGRRSTDEMAELVLQVLPGTPEDHRLLTEDFAVKAIAVDTAGAEKRVRDTPDDFEAHHELALYYLEAGRIDEATARFEQTLGLNPRFAAAYYNLGIILAGQGRLDEAEGRFHQALATDPEHVDALTNLGVVLQARGRLDDAAGHYRRAIEIDPEAADAHLNLAVALQSLGRVDDAIVSYRRALAIRPTDVDAHTNLGVVLAGQGNAGVAIGHYLQALELNPVFAQAHHHLAVALAGAHRPEEAIDHHRRALDAQPDEPAFLNGLAWLLATCPDPAVQDPAEAIRLAEHAASLTARRHVLVLDTLAAAYAAAGQYARAVTTAQAALALIPDGQAAELAAAVDERLRLYTRRQPYRQP